MSGNFNEIFKNSTDRERTEFLNNLAKIGGGKSISEASGVAPNRKVNESGSLQERLFKQKQEQEAMRPFINEEDKQEAEVTLAYIRAAIAIVQSTNEIACELHIGHLPPIGISVNNRLVKVLQEEESEIMLYLQGEPNNYE